MNPLPPFGSSALARRPDQQQQQQQQEQHRAGGGGGQQGRGFEKEVNLSPLDEIQEDQREEISEAVCFLD